METDRILRLPELLHTTGHSRTSLYREIRAGRFPQPVPIGDRSRGWRNSEVQAWIRDLEPPDNGAGAGAEEQWDQPD